MEKVRERDAEKDVAGARARNATVTNPAPLGRADRVEAKAGARAPAGAIDGDKNPRERRKKMPGRDGSGPMGQGPMTGRGMGCCVVETPGGTPVTGRGLGRGFGRGMGLGRGFGRGMGGGRGGRFFGAGWPGWMQWAGYAAPYVRGYLASRFAPDPAQEKQALQNEVQALQGELEYLKQRLTELEAETETK